MMHKVSITVVVSILATGALLNLAGSGLFGAQVQKLAKYVTTGYGAA
jgi:hypothetical protein